MSLPLSDYVTAAEVAAALGVTQPVVRRMAKQGKLPHSRISSRLIVFRRSALEQHIKRIEKPALV